MAQAWQALKFFGVGTTGTLAYAGLYLLMCRLVAQPVALVTAWLLSTLVTNLAHRVVTFGVRDARGSLADALAFLVTSLLGLAITQAALLARDLPPAGEVAVIAGATGVAGIVRFVAMRWWVGRRSHPPAGERSPRRRAFGAVPPAGWQNGPVPTERNDRVPEHHRLPHRIEREAAAGHDDHGARPLR